MTSSNFFLVAIWYLPCLLSSIVAAEVTVVGSTFTTTRLYATATISVPLEARSGDLLVIFIGGSGRPFKDMEPSGPIPSSGWQEVIRFGPKDINQKAYYKIYREGREKDPFGNSWLSTYDINQGKSIFATMVAIRGADATAPIVDAAADGIDTIPESWGGSRAPAVSFEEGGIGIFSFAFDDPLKSIALNTPGASAIASFKAVSGDGMAVFSSSNNNVDGTVGPIDVNGTFTRGAGNEVAISISVRPENPQGKSAELVRDKSPLPTAVPTRYPAAIPSMAPSMALSISPSISPSTFPSAVPSIDPTYVQSKIPTSDSPLLRASVQKLDTEEDGIGGFNGNSTSEEYNTTNTPKCGDGTTIVLGETFCYTKIERDGTYSRNDVKNCSFFELGDTEIRLKNHCDENSDAGSSHCPACQKHLKT